MPNETATRRGLETNEQDCDACRMTGSKLLPGEFDATLGNIGVGHGCPTPRAASVPSKREGTSMTKNLFAIAIATAVGVPSAAYPCGNAVMLEGDDAVRLVASAEAALEAGRAQAAWRKLVRHEFGEYALHRRAELVLSAALIQLGKTEQAVDRLRYLTKNSPKDTVVRTRLGEALSFSKRRVERKKALRMLSDLADRDLMADARGYLALARLQARFGNEGGRDAALTRCRAMAKSPKLCVVPAMTKTAPRAKRSKRPVG